VEVNNPASTWHKSSYSKGATNCVEVAEGAKTRIRDTRHRSHGTLEVSAAEWEAFLDAVKNDRI